MAANIAFDAELLGRYDQPGPRYTSYPTAPAFHAGFDATATIKRSDWGIGKYAPMVSDEISIRITTEAVESKAWAEMQKPKA